MYQYAANLYYGGQNSWEIKTALLAKGLSEEDATVILGYVGDLAKSAKRARGKKDMLYGAMWCIGGTALTMAHIGFIFWGAIVFGAIQFFRGVSNL
jgi:hypothetical protein